MTKKPKPKESSKITWASNKKTGGEVTKIQKVGWGLALLIFLHSAPYFQSWEPYEFLKSTWAAKIREQMEGKESEADSPPFSL